MNLLLFDDDGGCWDGGSTRVRDAFNSPYSGGEFTDYVVKNLGFIAINIYGPSIQIRLNPRCASARSLEGLSDWLSHHRSRRVAVSRWERGEWRIELMQPGEVLYHIDRLIRQARVVAGNATSFKTRPAKPEDLPDATALAALLQHLPESLEAGQQSALLNLLRRSLGDRYLLAEGEPTLQKLVFREFGSDIYRQQLKWNDKPIGKPVDEQPDKGYGRFVLASYEEVLKTGRPRFEDVDAIVDWAEQGRMRLRYRRVLIPFWTRDGKARVLCGSIKDDRVDLRVG